MAHYIRKGFRILPALAVVFALVLTSTVGFYNNKSSVPVAHAAQTATAWDYEDSDSNGTVDRVKITFDENVTQCTYEAGDWSFPVAGTINITGTSGITGNCNNTDNFFYLNVTGTLANTTGGATAPTITYADNGTTGSIATVGGAINTFTGQAVADTAKPIFVSSVSDDTDNNGTVDQTVITYSESVAITDAGAGADGFPGVAFNNSCVAANADYASAGTTTSTVNLGSCTASNTALLIDPTYTAASGQIQDLAGAPNEMADAETVTGTDGAQPVALSVTNSLTSNRNVTTLVYSEAITCSNGASTTTKSDLTTAGTIAGMGSFATTGNATVPTTKNTLSGCSTATLVVTFANEAGGFFNTGSSTEFSGVFTPVGSAEFVDAVALQVNTAGTPTLVSGSAWDLVKPTLTSITVSDSAGPNGRIDRAVLVFNSNMRDANFTNGNGALGTTGTPAGTFTTGAADDTTTTFNRTADDNSVDTTTAAGDFTYSGATTSITDLAGNLLDTATDGQIATADSVEVDAALPIVVSVTNSLTLNRNVTAFVFSEAITCTDGASTATKADLTTAGTIAGLGSFATAGNATVATTKNTLSGCGTTTIAIAFANEANSFFAGTSTTEFSGVFTPVASAEFDDAANNQVNTAATPTLAGGGSWDLTKPTITSITVSDSAGNNGRIDRAVLVFNSSMRDANFTNGDGALGTTGTPAGTFTSGTADDATTTFNRTADDNAVDTSTAAGDFTYTGATTLLTDLAGNLLNTATDGQIATADSVEADGANPIIISVTNSLTSNRNVTTFVYSEAITCTNGASTATKSDLTAAGTIAGMGSFGTTGNSTVNTTKNTLSGCASATLVVSFANEVGGFFSTASSTEFSGVFTPAASAEFDDAANNQVNTSATTTLVSGSAWDLTKPTLTSISVQDAVTGQGRIDRALLVFNSNMRDSNFTNANSSIGVTGTTGGTLLVAGIDDAFFTVDRTDDNALDTSIAAGDFVYTGATTFLTDLAGNLLDTATDGTIASGDMIETDQAPPVIQSAVYTDNNNDGAVDRVIFTTSTDIGIACTSFTGATDFTVTTPGTVNLVASAGDTCGSNGTSTVTITLATPGNANTTGGGVNPVVNYIQPGNGVEDGAGQDLYTANNVTATDGAAPVVSALAMLDTNGNGIIDRVSLTYTENLTNTAAAANGFDVTSVANHGSCTGESADPAVSPTLLVNFTCTNVFTAVGDLTVGFTANVGVVDAASNQSPSKSFTSASTPAITDGAAPVTTLRSYQDNGVNGSTDRMVLTFSENVNYNGLDLSQFAIVNQGLTSYDDNGAPNSVNGTGTNVLFFVTSGTTNLTGVSGGTEPTVQYTQSGTAGNRVNDGNGNDMASDGGAVSLTDDADPVRTGVITYLDNDANGTVDRTTLIYTENVTYTYQDADWTAVANGLTGYDVTGCTACTNVSTVILTATANAGLTGVSGGTEPTLAYTAGNVIADATANNAANFTATSLTDGAAPQVTAISMTDSNGNGIIDRFDATYSENLANTAAGVNGFVVSSASDHGACGAASADPAVSTALVITSTCTNVFTAVGDLTVTFTANAGITDAASNQSPSKVFNSGSTPALTDNARPIANNSTLNYNDNNRQLVVNFSETINAGTTVTGAYHLNNTTGTDVVTLSVATASGNGTALTWVLTEAQRVAALAISGVAGGDGGAVVLDIDAGGFTDMAALTNLIDDNNTVTETADTKAPNLSTWTLNLNTNALVMNFDETVNVVGTPLDVTTVTIQDAATQTVSYTLTNSTTASPNGTSATITLSTTDKNALLGTPGLADSIADSFLRHLASLVDDMAGNAIVAIADGAAIQATTFTADTTSPNVTSWSLDLGTKTLTLNFDENVDASTLAATGITIQDAATAVNPTFTLTGGSTTSIDGPVIVVTLLDADVVSIQALPYAKSITNTFLIITTGVIDDLSGNNVTAITNGSALQASSVNTGGGRRSTSLSLALCGNGIVESSESCDTGGDSAGCLSCQIQSGFTCNVASTPSVCAAISSTSGSSSVGGGGGGGGGGFFTPITTSTSTSGTVEAPGEVTIKTTLIETRTDMTEVRNTLQEYYGERFVVPLGSNALSEGVMEGANGEFAFINPGPNVVLDGELPEMTIERGTRRINVSFSREANLLRPLWIMIANIGETDWRKLRISDTEGTIIHSFSLDASGNISLSLNYLRNFSIRISTPISIELLSDAQNDPEAEAIQVLMQLGIITGNPDGTFGPNDSLNRAATSKLIGLLLGLMPDTAQAGDQWYSALQRALAKAGMIKGNVAPETLELRANFLALIAKAKGINNNTLPACTIQTFDDVPTNEWYCSVIEYARSAGWIRESSGNFDPSGVVTRSWAVGVLKRAFFSATMTSN